MWNKMNRLWNTVAIAPRLAGTTLNTSADLLNTFLTLNKDAYEVAADSASRVRDVLLWAWTNKTTGFKKAINIATSPVVAAWAAVEWFIARPFVQPLINGAVNVRNTWVNTAKNAWYSTLWRIFSKKPLSDFSFKKTDMRKLYTWNRFSKLQFWNKDSSDTVIEKSDNSEEEKKETKTVKMDNRPEKQENETKKKRA